VRVERRVACGSQQQRKYPMLPHLILHGRRCLRLSSLSRGEYGEQCALKYISAAGFWTFA
jgi:hypothetical protein